MAARGALMLKLRLDRIDALDDGRKVIVDQRPRAAKPEPDWSRRRPVNVQLPFYASVRSGAEVAGLVLAQIHARQVAAQAWPMSTWAWRASRWPRTASISTACPGPRSASAGEAIEALPTNTPRPQRGSIVATT